MLMKRSLQAGLMMGAALAVLALVFTLLFAQLRAVWPIVFIPAFLTGVVAVNWGGAAVRTPLDALMAGALAGLVVAVLSLPGLALAVSLQAAIPNWPYVGAPQSAPGGAFGLVAVLIESPYYLPREQLFMDLPLVLPFPWPYVGTLASGAPVSRIPLPWIWFFPLGIVLGGLQAWLYFVVGRQLEIASRVVDGLARHRARFQSKLLLGFALLGGLIFIVGWLGFAALEDMHATIHQGRLTTHWLDHTLQAESSFQLERAALAKLAAGPDDTALAELTRAAQQVASELAHLKQVPPPAHPTTSVTASGLAKFAVKWQPAVQAAEARFSDFNQAIDRMVAAYRAGDVSAAQAQLRSTQPLQEVAESALARLGSDLDVSLVAWSAQVDDDRHEQEPAVMLLVLLATGLTFPLGFVFSQVVVRPVSAVASGLQRIGAGDFSGNVTVANADELGELAERVNQMSGELRRLYGELEQQREQLEEASRHKSEFLANMSHELRTPLNAINGFAEVLIERMVGDVNEKQEEYLTDILTSGQHLLSLINEILDLAKVEAGQMDLDLEEFSLREALQSGLTMLKERAGRHNITLSLDIEDDLDLIEADERKVKQVVFNLLSNATKFTPDGGRIELSAQRVDGQARIRVSDTGVGIAPQDLDKVFGEFQQVGAGASEPEGTGLGLAISRKFVELHGGLIWVESVVGVGSTFSFTLPMQARVAATTTPTTVL